MSDADPTSTPEMVPTPPPLTPPEGGQPSMSRLWFVLSLLLAMLSGIGIDHWLLPHDVEAPPVETRTSGSGTWLCVSPTGSHSPIPVENPGDCPADDLALWCNNWGPGADGQDTCLDE